MRTKKQKSDGIRLRVLFLGIGFALFFGAIAARAVQLHLFMGPSLSAKADGQVKREVNSTGERGIIYDANMGKLAISVDITSIGAHPGQVKDPVATADALAEALDLDRKAVREKFSSTSPFVWVARHATPGEVDQVVSLDLPGVVFKPEYSRFYPYKSIASHVIGFAGIDGRGLEGIEFYYDRVLKGGQARIRIVRDALGRVLGLESETDMDHSGKNLVLTIDRTIQYITETALEEAVNDGRAKSGIAIVMDPKTGAVLALAHYPFFNPNNYGEHSRDEWRNRAITDPFEPGSTMKIFSAAAALESGAVGRKTTFYCENGAYRIGRNVVHDTHKYAWLTVEEIVKYSSNIGATKLGEIMGSEKLHRTLKDFGFGELTGIDCPGETPGMLSSYQRWTRIDAATISFGQGIAVSAIQLVAAVSAIANGGVLMKPFIARAITDKNGALVEKFGPKEIRRAVSQETADTMASILATVTAEGGTGTSAAMEGYQVCGKTGTAQKIGENGTYVKGRYVASFVGFVPQKNPELTIFVMLDEPKKSIYGGVVAAPAFKKIALQTLNYLNVAPGGKSDGLTAMKDKEAKG